MSSQEELSSYRQEVGHLIQEILEQTYGSKYEIVSAFQTRLANHDIGLGASRTGELVNFYLEYDAWGTASNYSKKNNTEQNLTRLAIFLETVGVEQDAKMMRTIDTALANSAPSDTYNNGDIKTIYAQVLRESKKS